jgi:hypothetical protein
MFHHRTNRTLAWLSLFSIAMGFLEAAVVLYLRELYYPEGFNFPLKLMSNNVAIVEVFREIATLVMLLGAGVVAGRTRTEKFGLFLYCFAVWDIFYYIFLKLTLNWPESLMTWDILFLIPTTWVGPVVAPVIVSLTMILLAITISKFTDQNLNTRLTLAEWALLLAGAITLTAGFVYDYVAYLMKYFGFRAIFNPSNMQALMAKATGYVPSFFPWAIFLAGELAIIGAIGLFFFRNRRAQ